MLPASLGIVGTVVVGCSAKVLFKRQVALAGADAISVAKEMYNQEKIDSIILCPGFTHTDVAGIFQALQGKVGITVARGDGPSNKISQAVIQKEFGR